MRGMYGRLLTAENYELLMSMSRVGDIVRWLKENGGYAETLKDISEASVHRSSLENAFHAALIVDAKKLSAMLGAKEKKMMALLMARVEIDILKRIIRSIYTGIPVPSQVLQMDLSYSRQFDLFRCLEAKHFMQLLEALRGTGYDQVLTPLVLREDISTFDMEEALDEYYFRRLKEGAKKYLSGTDLKAAENFWGSEIDAQNILWTYRYKKYYHFSKEETLRHLVPNKYKIRKEQLLRLADSSVADFERVVAETRYSRLFANSRDVEWDRRVTDYLCRMYMRQIRRSAYNFTTIAAYLYLKEIDIRNIITIVEGVRYRIGPSEIRRYLITGVDYGN